MEQTIMMARFNDQTACANALAEALEKGVAVRFSGTGALVANGKSTETQSPTIIFRGTMMDGLLFMQHGASFTGPIY